ncbi:MAG: hypothetical protein SPE88_02975 [Paludibacteraceae bacterium]|nr:hypothetical protein [Paludibacteraceae bacterium]
MIIHGNKQISERWYARKASEGGGAVRLTNIIRGAQVVFGGTVGMWLKFETRAAILAAFGQTDGKAVIKATNAYLNALAATDPTKASALAGFINEDPMLAPYFIQGGELKYFLSGKDELVNGAWVDRINSEVKWLPKGSCTKTDGGYLLNGDSGYLIANNALLYDLGNHFRVMAEFTTTTDSYVIIDFGSIHDVKKNISFQTVSNNGQTISMNWKMKGNSSNPGVTIKMPVTTGHHYFTWAIVDAGNGYDKFVASIDGVTKETAGIIPKATNFGGYKNWNNKNFYIGRGVANGYAMSNGGIIHNFMIHVID